MQPNVRNKIFNLHPPSTANNEAQKEKLREILKTPTGFIHMINKYEEVSFSNNKILFFRNEMKP